MSILDIDISINAIYILTLLRIRCTSIHGSQLFLTVNKLINRQIIFLRHCRRAPSETDFRENQGITVRKYLKSWYKINPESIVTYFIF